MTTLSRNQPSFTYTNKDYNSIKTALTQRLRNLFPDTYKDFTESPIGQQWLEIGCFVFDQLSYFVDYTANEQFIPTARDRESLVNLSKLIGYQPKSYTAASVSLLATIASIQTSDVILQAGTSFASESGVNFEILSDQRILAGNLTANIVATAGKTLSQNFSSTGEKWIRLLVEDDQWIEGSIRVFVNNVEWTKIDSLVYADSTSQYFSIDVSPSNNFRVEFGDGVSGAIPPVGSTIEIRYRVGGGISGNIPISTVNSSVLGYLDGTSPAEYVSTTLVNQERGSGGEDKESTEHIRYWAPKSVKTNNRAVTEFDFDTLASLFNDPTYGSLARAKSRLKRNCPELNTVQILGWARDSQGNIIPPSNNLKTAVYNYFMNNGEGAVRLICLDVEVLDGTILYIDLNLNVVIDKNSKSDVIISSIETAVRQLFDEVYNQPGQDVRLSQLYDTIMNVDGVQHCLFNTVQGLVKYNHDIDLNANGTQKQWTGWAPNTPEWGVAPYSVVISDGVQNIIDDGNGNLIGEVDPTGNNTITYEDVLRSQIYLGPPGSTNYAGTIADVPITPGSVKISVDNQTVYDNGGKLVGDVDPLGTNTINYDTGAYNFTLLVAAASVVRVSYYQRKRCNFDFTFKVAPTAGSVISIEYKAISGYTNEDQIATGDGLTSKFKGKITKPPAFRKTIVFCDSSLSNEIEASWKLGTGGATYNGSLIKNPVPGSIVITSSGMTVTDDGYGHLIGDIDPTATLVQNVVDYATGTISVKFLNVVGVAVPIQVEYQASDSQVANDDGYEKIVGEVDTVANNYISPSGDFEIKFANAPASGVGIFVIYFSLLDSPSEDVNVEKDQLAVLNRLVISTSNE